MTKKSLIKAGNEAFQNKNYFDAMNLYKEALSKSPELKNIIQFNIELINRLHNNDQKNKDKGESLSGIDKSTIPRVEFDSMVEEFYNYSPSDISLIPLVKAIAFYLPQFHPFDENDRWWGKGFTEWTNVSKASPNFDGHHQPHLPIHFGFYDLRVQKVMEEQAKLAKEYGISGFCYYFYWFDGKVLMEAPLRAMLNNKNVDIPFCLTWANENWTRRWDGQENDILIGQNHSIEDSINFINYLRPYFEDPRYIKINERPVLIIYRANIIPDIKETVKIFRREAKKFGFPGLYIICAQTFGIRDPEPFGCDAAVEFPPHTVSSTDIRHELNNLNNKFNGYIFSYKQVVENAVKNLEPNYKVFRAAMLSWDNTARKQLNSHTFHNFSLLKYKQWLSAITSRVFNNPKYHFDEKIVFINAWNEWAEGTHLEPDRKFGYGYLEATKQVLEQYKSKDAALFLNPALKKINSIAIIIHIHYEDVIEIISQYLLNFGEIKFDLYISVTSLNALKKARGMFPAAYILLVENRGRDVLPFIDILRAIHGYNYLAVCKLHTKKSAYRDDGVKLRNDLYESLVGSTEKIKEVISLFKKTPQIGIAVPKKFIVRHTSHNMTYDTEIVDALAQKMNLKFAYSSFPAGSMFWFRQSALDRLLLLGSETFEIEEGLADGTAAHGVERLIMLCVTSIGYDAIEI